MIGLFGGSFDPIHHGHLIAAQSAVEQLGLDELRFVPARQQPFKAGRHGAGPGERAEMVRLATAGVPHFGVERCELEREGPSYTVDTLRQLAGRHPGVPLTLLIGADAAAELPAWHEAAELPRLARIVAFGRGSSAVRAGGPIAQVITVPAIDISATAVRARVRAGLSLRFWVPDAVAEYITARQLYRDGA